MNKLGRFDMKIGGCGYGRGKVEIGWFTSEVLVWIAVVRERYPHPGHLLGDADVGLAVGTA